MRPRTGRYYKSKLPEVWVSRRELLLPSSHILGGRKQAGLPLLPANVAAELLLVPGVLSLTYNNCSEARSLGLLWVMRMYEPERVCLPDPPLNWQQEKWNQFWQPEQQKKASKSNGNLSRSLSHLHNREEKRKQADNSTMVVYWCLLRGGPWAEVWDVKAREVRFLNWSWSSWCWRKHINKIHNDECSWNPEKVTPTNLVRECMSASTS